MTSNPDLPRSRPGWHTDPWNPSRLRYFDGHEWTGTVAERSDAPSGHSPQQPAPQPAPQFPLGQRLLHLRALPQPSDIDVACLVEDSRGRALAQIRLAPSSHGRQMALYRFGIFSPQGVPLGYFRRTAGIGIRDSIVVTDAFDRTLGRLRRTNNFWQRFRSSAIDMTLESAQEQPIGHTRVSVSPETRFSEVNEPIYDVSGLPVGTVRRQWRYVDTSVTFFDYTLECTHPTVEPTPQLMLGIAFAHYFYDRHKVGGPLAIHSNF
ncbi:Protein of uncharacterised function (DUF2510) [Mycolicibacterium fortuitum]|uniref:Protein of uncharacterized function (DUF2510) n=1 Tax=Mycolicibacterium fortuitum TaxID=1766 RepID=A0A378WD18_MYCFO|nr:Protein of uncharacterised function (DUF2510) [Mycolicibacterium fortuitum]